MCNCGGSAKKSGGARYSGVQRATQAPTAIHSNTNIQRQPTVVPTTKIVRYSALHNYTNKNVQNENNESQENVIEAPEVNNENGEESEVVNEVIETVQGD